ncbi:MAG TPA: GAF domain-containing sensor histidine kinase [Symbiobacteriaceae bacterium]|nr:GAF domain-containing sensor histidine kinase [Symbiobacteriaceae bacterium]
MVTIRSRYKVGISLVSLAFTGGAAIMLPLLSPEPWLFPAARTTSLATALLLSILVWATQRWRVAIRGTRGDVSISMAIDVATMLMFHPFVAGAGSALGTALYHFFTVKKEHRPERTIVRGWVTFAAVALGGWVFHMLRPDAGPLHFPNDGLAVAVGIAVRLALRVLFYPLGMAALRPEPLKEQLKHEWERLPLVPFLLTTTLGTLAVLIWQTQPWAVILVAGPLAATWSATQEFQRLNELNATLEDKVADRTARLGETVRALKRRLSEFEAMDVVTRVMAEALHPDEVLSVIARETCRVTGGDSALVLLVSEDQEFQYIRAAHGQTMEPYIGVGLPISTSLAGLVLRTGEVLVSLDPPNDPRLNQNLVKAGSWRCVLEAPLRSKDRVLGVLVAATSKTEGFDEQHSRMLSLFGNQAGLFLENSRLHEKERDASVLEERNRLARELHDSVTQVLFSLTLNLEAAGGLLEKKPEKAATLITRSGEMAAEALAEMRSLIFELRPSALQEKGLAMALTNHINLFRRRSGLEVSLQLEGEERLPPDEEFCLYRVAQEALTNASKHAKARHVSVSYSVQPDLATLVVDDDGVGFDPSAGRRSHSFGMVGMKERLVAVGGTLHVRSQPGHGTRIEARIPLHHSNSGGGVS